MQFSEFDLDNKLLDAINKMGYETPTSIQQQAIPEALQGRDILASAPTGTGKTAAFLIPAIQYLLDFPRRDPGFARVLVMTPTRELAYQIHEQCELLAKRTHLKIGVVTGGINYGTHKEIFEKNNDILIATPGRLMEYLETENFHAEHVEMLIIDEADRMLDMGFKKEMLLVNTLKNPDVTKAIVFVKTRERLETLIGELTTNDVKAAWLRGEMPQDKRMKAMENFHSGKTSILVATDVAARGIDVSDISHVINFDMPRTADVYVHRIGRTGRAGKKGIAISLVEAHDIGILYKVERYVEQKLKRRVIRGVEPQHKEAKPPAKKRKDPVKMKAKKKAKVKKKK